MMLHAPALPAGIELDIADDVAQEQAVRRRERIESTVTMLTTITVVLMISMVNVAIEFLK